MRIFVFLSILLSFSACNMRDTPLYYKIIKTGKVELKWYYYSRVTSDSPDFIDITSNGKTITICKSLNIFDVNIVRDHIVLSFIEKPMLQGAFPLILDTAFGMKIYLDTVQNVELKKIETFKQDK